ncbi:nuclear pore complex protein DDB_G0274915-like [Diorhabda sublineata]|uniref:nuclear pore complex protein DDB_G0274915-like n=1 Tax=Diorhabda sublineata TaxID=1163346 RepID=UPI0024E13547|nr:nuclear pore complex protein DDB_G0274915-like [Diorhabda sublineata]
MFNSSKLNDSSKFLKTTLLNPYDDSIHEPNRTFSTPKITSTPLHSVFATPPKNQIMTPRRYSLSEVATPPRNNIRDDINIKSQQYTPGPLLSSTKFNLSVSTFEDAKSPGLVNRIVQYNDEVEKQRRPATHQAKYGTVGLFPIVHLFKNKLPVLEQKPRRVTIRVATPDKMKHTTEYNRKLLEGLVKPSGSNHNISHLNHSEHSTSTRSVLDALKEISRKRIHASEEIDLHEETGKRLRTENEVCTDSNKRGRDESPQLETSTSPNKPASKKICMYDEYLASRSSMDFAFNRSDSKRKYISTSTVTENPKESKQVKLVNVETQTIEEEKPENTEDKCLETEDDAETDKTKKVKSILKVFDDSPLERIRKNRLAALMGNLVGKDPVLKTKPDYPDALSHQKDPEDDEDVKETTDKPLVSILAQKSPKKTAKHVTFNIPETTTANDTVNDVVSSLPDTKQTSIDVNREEICKSTSTTSVITNSSIFTSSSTTTNSVPSTTTTTTSVPSTASTSITVENSKSFTFGNDKKVENPTTSTTVVPVTSSPPKIGGFKFDLQKSPSKPSLTSSFNLNSQPGVNISTDKADTGTAKSTSGVVVSSSESSKPSFTFGSSGTTFNFGKTLPTCKPTDFPSLFVGGTITNAVTTSAKTSFSTVTSIANKDLITSPSATSTFASPIPAFGSFQSKVDNSSTGFGILPTTTANGTTAFGISTTNSNFGTNPNFAVTTTPTFGSTTAPSFGTTTPGFGTTSTKIPDFGTTSSTTPSFGTTSTATPGFATTSTKTPSFGTTTTPGFGGTTTTTTTPGFGTTIPGFGTTTGITTPGFGTTTTTTPGLGTTTPGFGTTTSGFGNSSGFGSTTPAFGNSTTQTFGTNGTSGFGSPTTTANSIFGPSTTISTFGGTLNSTFGTATTASSGFGTAAFGTGTNQAPGFGTTVTSAFAFGGSTAPSSTGFGIVTTASGFGGNVASIFSKTNVPSFGGTGSSTPFTETGFGAPVSSASAFGTVTTTSSFNFGGGNASFTAPATTSSIFGTTQSPFGGAAAAVATTTTTSSNVNFTFTGKGTTSGTFPSTNTVTPSFGSTFGQSGTGFGAQTTGFGTSNKGTFGNVATGFGSNAATPAFGGTTPAQPFTTTNASFNKTQPPTQSNFGSPQFSFNQQNNTVNRSSVFTFGSASGEKSGVFNFGASSGETAKKFDFNVSSSAAPPAFGASFGGNTSAPAFGATAPLPAGGFSIGAGTPTPKRTQIKAKRRT